MKCFYHTDMDGRGAAAVVARYEENWDKENFIPFNYHKDTICASQLNLEKYERVYIVDISFTEKTVNQLQDLLNATDNVIWIDHHNSSVELEANSKYEWLKDIPGLRSTEHSAAALTYMHLYQKEYNYLPTSLQLISDYDSWKFKYGDYTSHFKIGIDTIEHEPYDCNLWNSLLTSNVESSSMVQEIISKGKIIKNYIDKEFEISRKSMAFEVYLEDYKCLAINRKGNSWLFENKLKEEYALGITFAYNGKVWQYTMFSDKDNPNYANCSKIAEKYGGGGHVHAAGFHLDYLLITQLKRNNLQN